MQHQQSRDKPYLYTLNPSPIHPKSNKIDHYLKIVDFYIKEGSPKECLIEPIFGKYEPDLFFRNPQGKTVCVEIQITPISAKKMQEKVNQFASEYSKTHDAQILIISTNNDYKNIRKPKGFQIFMKPLPIEKCFKI